MNYNVYGRITKIKKGVLTLNTGHEIHVTPSHMITESGEAAFAVNQIRFFTVKNTSTNRRSYCSLSYIDSNVITRKDAEEMQTLTRNLDQQTDIVINTLKTLNNQDRSQILKAVGLAVSGTISVTATLGLIYEGYELCTGGPFNPMNWVTGAGIALGSAGYCAILYEQLSCDHQKRADTVKRYQRAQQAYSRMMLKYMPWEASNYKSLNPTVDSLVSKARTIFNVSLDNARSFWHNTMTVNASYVGA